MTNKVTMIQWNGEQDPFKMLGAESFVNSSIMRNGWKYLYPYIDRRLIVIGKPNEIRRVIQPGDWFIIDNENGGYFMNLEYLDLYVDTH